jgi:hypothetical protein
MKKLFLGVFLISSMAFSFEEESFSKIVTSQISEFNTTEAFAEIRRLINEYGVEKFKNEMIQEGHFTEKGLISHAIRPFNPFARILNNKLKVYYSMTLLKDHGLEEYEQKYFIAKNTPDNDANWQNEDVAWVGKSSMSKNHQFLLIKNEKWSSFNVLTLGLLKDFDQNQAIDLLNEMELIAKKYAKNAFGTENIGLYFHVYPTNSVQTLHLHIVDLDNLGPSFTKLSYKNLSLSSVREQLQKEQNSNI